MKTFIYSIVLTLFLLAYPSVACNYQVPLWYGDSDNFISVEGVFEGECCDYGMRNHNTDAELFYSYDYEVDNGDDVWGILILDVSIPISLVQSSLGCPNVVFNQAKKVPSDRKNNYEFQNIDWTIRNRTEFIS